MNVLGLIAFGENPAACLLQDGVLTAFAEEERFTRLKGSDGMFPGRALAYCLAAAKLPLDGIDRIAMGWNCLKYPWQMARNFGSTYLKNRRRERRAHHEHGEGASMFVAAEALLEYHPTLVREKIARGLR